MKNIAILITVFNRKATTLRSLYRLYNQCTSEEYGIDVFLTDDGCTDGTPEAVKKEFPQIHIVKGNGNLFWNRAMFVAWQEAAKTDYDFYLWLNDDTFVYSNMIDKLLKSSYEKDNKAIIVGATQSCDHKQLTYGGRLDDRSIPKPNGELTEVSYFNGNIVLVPKSVFQKLGNLDYYFTHSKGDFDYGMRAKRNGIKIYQVGEILGECDLHESLDKWCDPAVPFRQRWKALQRPNGMPPKETYYFEKKHYGVLIALFHYVTIYLRCFFPIVWVKIKKQ